MIQAENNVHSARDLDGGSGGGENADAVGKDVIKI